MDPMLPPPQPTDSVWALTVAIIYFGSFIVTGMVARAALGRLMKRVGVELNEVQEQAGPNRSPREVFLLGSWRKER